MWFKNIKSKQLIQLVFVMGCVSLFLNSCKKLVEVDPPEDRITQDNVFADDFTATAVMTHMYSIINNLGPIVAKFSGLSSDELSLWTGGDAAHSAYYTNSLVSNQSINSGKEIWEAFYPYVFECNAVIEGISKSNKLSEPIKKQLLGEAKFMRAFFYFYLVNLYGDIPMPLTTDPEINRLLPRSTKDIVYQQIIIDLLEAQDRLSSVFLDGELKPYPSGNVERVRPSKWSAIALLARVYLYHNEYEQAESTSTQLIQNSSLFGSLGLNEVFLKNSREAIWQLQPVTSGWNTNEARLFHLTASPAGFRASKPVYLNPSFVGSFELGDNRRTEWVNTYATGGNTYYFSYKYKVGAQNVAVNSPSQLTEYSMMLRLAEQYLIRAEARAHLNNISGAQSDLNVIRNRAGLPNTNAGDKTTLLNSILKERRIELFCEWGNRWLDLKRTGQIDAVMQATTPNKGGTWENKDQLYPIPYNELLYNPNMRQNSGY